MGGLSPLSNNYEDIICCSNEVDELLSLIESLKEIIVEKYNNYYDKYDLLLELINKISFDNLNELLKKDKKLNTIIGNKKNETEFKDKLKEIIEIELDDEYFNNLNSVFETNGFTLNSNIFEFCDLYNNKYKLIADGYLCPSNGDEDDISLNLYKNEDLVECGFIRVYYGFFELDEDGNAGNGAEEEISIDFERIKDYLPTMIKDTLADINDKIEKVDLLCKLITG